MSAEAMCSSDAACPFPRRCESAWVGGRGMFWLQRPSASSRLSATVCVAQAPKSVRHIHLHISSIISPLLGSIYDPLCKHSTSAPIIIRNPQKPLHWRATYARVMKSSLTRGHKFSVKVNQSLTSWLIPDVSRFHVTSSG